MVLTTYGRSSGFCIDPIEKKPLNHFYPGSSVLSFGTAGCNLACKFCQNWDISKSREMDTLMDAASPAAIADGRAGQRLPERRVHVQRSGHLRRVRDGHGRRVPRARHRDASPSPRATSASEARREFYAKMDAANVDLKGFTEEFYVKLCGARLAAGARHAASTSCARPTCGPRSRRCSSPARTTRRGARGDVRVDRARARRATCRCTSPRSIPTTR